MEKKRRYWSEDDTVLLRVTNKTVRYLAWPVFILGIVAIGFAYLTYTKKVEHAKLGLLAVRYLYHFTTTKELDDNMSGLKEITSPSVYNQLTIDNTDRTLNVYLKFKGNPSYVVPETLTDKYVIYKLNTTSVSSSRKFVFFFEVEKGKIVKVRESEVIDFVDNVAPVN